MPDQSQSEQWMTMGDAVFTLRNEGISISISKLSRLASSKRIKSSRDPLDERARLVDVIELRNYFNSSKRIRP
jgi:hypothetical protein